jgi:hypothetical protein
MNEEKLKQILNKIGQTDVPPDVTGIAEQTSQRFTVALNILQAQRPPLATFFIGFKRIAVAAVILFTFAIGLSVGRWSMPPQTAPPSLDVATYTSSILTHPTEQENKNSFWRQKALAAMQPRPYAQTGFDKAGPLNDYKQYLKEKHYE